MVVGDLHEFKAGNGVAVPANLPGQASLKTWSAVLEEVSQGFTDALGRGTAGRRNRRTHRVAFPSLSRLDLETPAGRWSRGHATGKPTSMDCFSFFGIKKQRMICRDKRCSLESSPRGPCRAPDRTLCIGCGATCEIKTQQDRGPQGSKIIPF